MQNGSSYDLKDNIVRPPSDLHSAAMLFRNSELLKNILGEDVHNHYSNFYLHEAMVIYL